MMGVCAAKPLRGDELLKATMNQILAHPETWLQRKWHCETSHCFAGWAQVLGGRAAEDYNCMLGNTIASDARQLLEIGYEDAAYLFDYRRTLEEIYFRVCQLLELPIKLKPL